MKRETESAESESEFLGLAKSIQLVVRTGTSDSWLKIEGVEGGENGSAGVGSSVDIQVDE